MRKWLQSIFALSLLLGFLSLASLACGDSSNGGIINPTPTPSLNGSQWAYCRQGNISSSHHCGYLEDYQVKMVLHYGEGDSVGENICLNFSCSENFSDIRFTEEDGETPLNYWFQEIAPGVSATLWVNFSYIYEKGTSFYLYYGNPEVGSAANGWKTFIIFNDGTTLDNWMEYEYEYDFDWKAVSYGGDKVIRCTSVDSGGWSNLYCGDETGTDYYVAECSIRAQEGLTPSNYQQGIGYYLNYPMAKWIDYREHDCWQLRDTKGTSNSEPDVGFDAGTWHEYSFVKNGNRWELFVDGESKITRDAEPAGQKIGMYANLGSPNHWVEFDDFRVRRYCFPEPDFGEWGEPVLRGQAPVFPTTKSATDVAATPTETNVSTPETTVNATPGTATGSTPTVTEDETPQLPGFFTPEPMQP